MKVQHYRVKLFNTNYFQSMFYPKQGLPLTILQDADVVYCEGKLLKDRWGLKDARSYDVPAWFELI